MPSDYILINATIPSYWGWTQYTPVIPKLYWDVYSQEERIKRLCMEYDKLTHYASMIADEVNELSSKLDTTLAEQQQVLADFQDKINAQIEEQNEQIAEQLEKQNALVDKKLDDMQKYIDYKFQQYAESMLVYDVTTGRYRPSMESMRRLFQALSYDHVGDRQLVSFIADNNTVAQLAQETVYHVAYSNRADVVIDDQDMTEGN